MDKVSIIIPFYKRWDLVHRRLSELYKFSPPGCEVILIDDFSRDLEIDGGIMWWREYSNSPFPLRNFSNPENIGFGGSMNHGASVASGDILVFLSNDVEISGDFITQIRNIIADNPKAFIGGEVIWWDGGWNSFIDDTGHTVVVPYANGWLLACTSDCWKELGGFDLRYGKFDYEDVDLSTSAILLGYDIIPLNSAYVKHAHQGATISTLGVDRLAHTKKNREIYIEKWKSKLSEFPK